MMKYFIPALIIAQLAGGIAFGETGTHGGDPRTNEFLKIAVDICTWFNTYKSPFKKRQELFTECFEKAYDIRKSLNSGPIAHLEFKDQDLYDDAGISKPAIYNRSGGYIKVNSNFWFHAKSKEKYVQVATEMAGLMNGLKDRYDVGFWAGKIFDRSLVALNNVDPRNREERQSQESHEDIRPLEVQFHELQEIAQKKAAKLVGDWGPVPNDCGVTKLVGAPVIFRIHLDDNGNPIIKICKESDYKITGRKCEVLGSSKNILTISAVGDNSGRAGSDYVLRMDSSFEGQFQLKSVHPEKMRWGDDPENQKLMAQFPETSMYANEVTEQNTYLDVIINSGNFDREGRRTLLVGGNCATQIPLVR